MAGTKRRAPIITYHMGPAGVARRLEVLAGQIRSGRREVLAFSTEPNKTYVEDDLGKRYVYDGSDAISLTVTELLGPKQMRARRRARNGR